MPPSHIVPHFQPHVRALLSSLLLAGTSMASHGQAWMHETAPAGGWASHAGGTSGGVGAHADGIVTVSSPSALHAALQAAQRRDGQGGSIIWVNGVIDMASADNGGPFTSHQDQAQRSILRVPSHTSVLGVGAGAQLRNATLLLDGVHNVIVRNLTIINPCDTAPVWDPHDGSAGNWNSEFDGLVIERSHHVWIDHNTFTDRPTSDDTLPYANGKLQQCHDGAADVKKGSDFVTFSYNVFDSHEKNNLIGHSDSHSSDAGHLRVTFHHNHFTNVAERAPRVRFGQVHVYSNYYEGDRKAAVYRHQYSIGVGYRAQILSEHNAFAIAGASQCSHVVKNPGSSSQTGAISDTGSLLNGAALNLAEHCHFAPADWAIPYPYSATAAALVPATVPQQAGAGKLASH